MVEWRTDITMSINFDEHIKKVTDNSGRTYASGVTDHFTISSTSEITPFTLELDDGYSIDIVTGVSEQYGSEPVELIFDSITDNTFNVTNLMGDHTNTITITSKKIDSTSGEEQEKAVSLSNLKKFKELCDNKYGSSSGGGGTQLYLHQIEIDNYYLSYISSINTPATNEDSFINILNSGFVANYFTFNEPDSENRNYILAVVNSTFFSSSTIRVLYTNSSITTIQQQVISNFTITDTVTPL